MLLDGRNLWKLHGRWLVFVVAAALAATGWTAVVARMNGRWPGGGSLSGLTLGILAAGIFVFEMALAARKTSAWRTVRWWGSAKAWMKAHLWLGLLTVPLVGLHSGGRTGGTLTTMLVLLFALVILSGMWGVVLQNVIPKLLLAEVPAETVYSQIDAVGRQYAEQAARVAAGLGSREWGVGNEPLVSEQRSVASRVVAGHAGQGGGGNGGGISGARRNVGSIVERSPQPRGAGMRAMISPVIAEAVREQIGPYLETGRGPGKLWRTREGQQWYFNDLRLRVAPELRTLVGQLEELCDRRRQLVLQERLHFWLHNWLWVHLPLSVALMLLLAAHVVFALMYG